MSVLSDIATGGAAVLGGILNASSAARANDISERQFRESMDFQKYQYEDMKQYNSAVNQVSRLRQAGQNPSLAFGSPASGQIGSVSSPSPGTQHPVDYSGIMSGAASIGQAFSQSSLNDSAADANRSQSMKNKADAFNTLIRNYTQYEKDSADIYRLRKEGKLSEEQANTEIARRQPMIDLMRSEMRNNEMQAVLNEEKTRTQIEETAQAAAERQIMEFRLSKEPDRFAAELQTMVSSTAFNYAQAYLAKVNAKSIDQLTPYQKQALAAGIQKVVSDTTLNTANKKYLEKKLGSFDTDKWFERGGSIVSGLTQGVMMGLGIGYFAKGLKAATVVSGFK